MSIFSFSNGVVEYRDSLNMTREKPVLTAPKSRHRDFYHIVTGSRSLKLLASVAYAELARARDQRSGALSPDTNSAYTMLSGTAPFSGLASATGNRIEDLKQAIGEQIQKFKVANCVGTPH